MSQYRNQSTVGDLAISRTDCLRIVRTQTIRLVDSLLNLFYPDTCFICAAPISCRKDRSVCLKCHAKADALRIQSPICPSCGLPMPNFESDTNFLCGKCILQPPAFSGARAFGYYSTELGRIIQGLKFHKRRNLVKLLIPFLVEAYYETWDRDEFDLIVPIPLHPKRRHDRGFNQAELLGRTLAHQIRIPFSKRVLIRNRSTPPQVGLTDSRRWENVRNAFQCVDSGRITDLRILLIDDVMTTGATAASAARTLMKNGARRVSVLTVARTV